MEPSKEFDELFADMKNVERSNEARRNTWLAVKGRMEKKKRRVFPAIISLAIVAIASFLIITYLMPSEPEQTAKSLTNEEVIMAVLEREYNGPDEELERLMQEWFDLQSKTNAESQEEYDKLLDSKEYKDYMNYYYSSFSEYFTENELKQAINTVMVFKYNHFLLDNDISIHLEKVQIEQEKDHPNIYRPIIEVSLTNSKGEKIFHTLKEEFIFSKTEPGKIGRYNVLSDSDGIPLRDKIENFDAYVTTDK
ncbi:hypothetical protein [Psychrobacillus sp. NPDC093200]|uniref:hypothetical protein n=1 Tax=Psychrobacillus sp. NPDC093200 TaxID=3390656 RepID=UPI003D087345